MTILLLLLSLVLTDITITNSLPANSSRIESVSLNEGKSLIEVESEYGMTCIFTHLSERTIQ